MERTIETILFGSLAFYLTFTFVYFSTTTASAALQWWADERGFRIIQRRAATGRDWRAVEPWPQRYCQLYRVILQGDGEDKREVLARIWPPWLIFVFWWSAARCRVEILWGNQGQPLAPIPPARSTMWDEELD